MSRRESDLRRPDLLATLALWLAPLAWLSDLLASSSLVPAACAHGRNAVLHLPAALALVCLGVAATLRGRDDGMESAGRQLVERVALGLALFFALLVVVAVLPTLLLSPCAE